MEIKEIIYQKRFKGHDTARGIYKLFHNYIKPSDQCLDIGAGDGYLIRFFQGQRLGNWTGIDPSPRSPLVQPGGIENLPFRDSSFDAISCTDVIEHLEDGTLHRGISEIARVLKPGRYFLVSTLLAEDFSSRICQCPKCGHAFHRAGHKQRFSQREITALLARLGLVPQKVIVTHLGAYSLHPWLISFLSIWPAAILGSRLRKLIRKDIILICQKKDKP